MNTIQTEMLVIRIARSVRTMINRSPASVGGSRSVYIDKNTRIEFSCTKLTGEYVLTLKEKNITGVCYKWKTADWVVLSPDTDLVSALRGLISEAHRYNIK